MSMITALRLLTGTAIIASTVLALKTLGDKLEEMEKEAENQAKKKFEDEQGFENKDVTSTAEKEAVKEDNEKIKSKIINIKEVQAASKAKKVSEDSKLEDPNKVQKEPKKAATVKKTAVQKKTVAQKKKSPEKSVETKTLSDGDKAK